MTIAEEEKNNNLNILNNFVGYGNPSAKYWFVGIDEHSADKSTAEINWNLERKRMDIFKRNYHNESYYLSNKDFKELDEKTEKSLTYEGIREIYNLFNTNEKLDISDIGDPKSNVFITNLYPLGRPTTRDNYNEFVHQYIFGDNFEEWKEIYWEEREKILSNFLKKYLFQSVSKEKYIFCLGTSKGLWYVFENLIGLSSGNKSLKFKTMLINGSNKYYGYVNENSCHIYCLYHPASTQFRYPEFQYVQNLKIKQK